AAPKRYDALGLGNRSKRRVRIGRQALSELRDGPHDGEKYVPQPLLHGGFRFLLEGLFRAATSVEHHVAAAEHRFHIREPSRLERLLQRRHLAVGWHDAPEKSRIA